MIVFQLFVELEELYLGENAEYEWQETARWIKFEEDVEADATRWGKPHVASLSFHSLLELRQCLAQGVYFCSIVAYFCIYLFITWVIGGDNALSMVYVPMHELASVLLSKQTLRTSFTPPSGDYSRKLMWSESWCSLLPCSPPYSCHCVSNQIAMISFTSQPNRPTCFSVCH